VALRRQALEAVLRVARLREQQAAAQAQRERKNSLTQWGQPVSLINLRKSIVPIFQESCLVAMRYLPNSSIPWNLLESLSQLPMSKE